jgi:hypothetical protein
LASHTRIIKYDIVDSNYRSASRWSPTDVPTGLPVPGRVPARSRTNFLFWVVYIIPPLYIMGGSLRKKFRFEAHSGGGSRKVFWPSSGTRLGSRPVPELPIYPDSCMLEIPVPGGVPAVYRNYNTGFRACLKTSGTGREPSRVPELDQKTFRLPPPEWGSNRNFLRRLPPIMYKGGIMYTTQKRKFFRHRAGTPPVVRTFCEVPRKTRDCTYESSSSS